ncbi:SDR family NAD(P)-dependent oxidoreductase [Enemella sp. A6]|uniref:SDR family NAD(P)-dependent oxidoreductase n=1 Tax=Enemella sp. A6 TaxID=3440152 RepID=UPI003EBA6FE9
MGLLKLDAGTAVITGAGSGLGEAFAKILAGRGMHVVVADISAERAAQVVEAIKAEGGSASAAGTDVTDYAQVEALAEQVYAEHGSVELLINNAGIEAVGRLWEESPQKWRQVHAVNLDGVFHGVRAFVPRMLTQGSPAIVANTASVGAVTTTLNQGAYVSTKHAVLALTETLHRELAAEGADIQVSVVMPNWVRTRIFSDANTDAPGEDQASSGFLDTMRASIEEKGMEPIDAARVLIEAIERGDFWAFTEERCNDLVTARGRHLIDLTDPIGT